MYLRSSSRQAGLSLIGVAIGAMVLAVLVLAGLYSVRYERNAFFDAYDSLMGNKASQEAAKKAKDAAEQAKSTITGKAIPAKSEGVLQKCIVNGHVTYSNYGCDNGKNVAVKISDSQGMDAPKPPPKEEKAPLTPTERAIEKATK